MNIQRIKAPTLNTQSVLTGLGKNMYDMGQSTIDANIQQRVREQQQANLDRSFNQAQANSDRTFNYNQAQAKQTQDNWQKTYDLQVKNANKPKTPNYSSVNIMGADGKPQVGILNSVTGEISNSGYGLYKEPSEIDRLAQALNPNATGLGANIPTPQPKPQPEQPKSSPFEIKTPQTMARPTQTAQQPVQTVSGGYKNLANVPPYLQVAINKLPTQTDKDGNEFKSFNGVNYLVKEASIKDINESKDEITGFKDSIAQTSNAIKSVNDIIDSDKLWWATGLRSPLAYIPDTDAYDIAGSIENLKSKTFMTAIQSMKGMGALSNAEGEKVASSIGNLDRGQSYEQVKKQLTEISDAFMRGRAKMIEMLKNRNVDTSEIIKDISDDDLMRIVNGGK